MAIQGRVLVIAGSDCSGGAGSEADQKVLAAHGCYAMTATTALTVQNTLGVKGIHIVPSDFVGQQIEACVEDIGVDVVKIGMLASAETIKTVSELTLKHKVPIMVLDPVIVSTSGAQLLPTEALAQLIQHLLPQTTVLTPNIIEAITLLSQVSSASSSSPPPRQEDIKGVTDVEAIARKIQALGPEWVLVKGGHLPLQEDLTVSRDNPTHGIGKFVVDVLVGPDGEVIRVQSPWQDTTSTHGTGCSLASAIAAHLAHGADVPTAVRAACRYVQGGIRAAPKLGSGHGPLDHFHSLCQLPFSPGYFVEYLLEHPAVKDVWARYVKHPFVMALGNNTLPLSSFKRYIVQDYLYLVHFARANALAAYKSTDPRKIAKSSEIALYVSREMELHMKYCEGFGITKDEILATEEHKTCTAYSRYIIDIGQSQDWFALQMTLAPCLIGYSMVAQHLEAHPDTVREGNLYWKWIENYAGSEYLEATRVGRELLEKNAVLQSPSRVEELVQLFLQATKMEISFWEMFPSC